MGDGIYKKFPIWKDYWYSYGGIKALLRSPYLWSSLIGAAVICPLAFPDFTGIKIETTWYDVSLNVIPSILGFTLAGYTIFFAFGDNEFIISLMGAFQYHEEFESTSPYKKINASLVHFIVVQVFSLSVAIIGSAWKILDNGIAFLGLWLFTYSIATALATTMAMFRLARMFERATIHKIIQNNDAGDNNNN